MKQIYIYFFRLFHCFKNTVLRTSDSLVILTSEKVWLDQRYYMLSKKIQSSHDFLDLQSLRFCTRPIVFPSEKKLFVRQSYGSFNESMKNYSKFFRSTISRIFYESLIFESFCRRRKNYSFGNHMDHTFKIWKIIQKFLDLQSLRFSTNRQSLSRFAVGEKMTSSAIIWNIHSKYEKVFRNS